MVKFQLRGRSSCSNAKKTFYDFSWICWVWNILLQVFPFYLLLDHRDKSHRLPRLNAPRTVTVNRPKDRFREEKMKCPVTMRDLVVLLPWRFPNRFCKHFKNDWKRNKKKKKRGCVVVAEGTDSWHDKAINLCILIQGHSMSYRTIKNAFSIRSRKIVSIRQNLKGPKYEPLWHGCDSWRSACDRLLHCSWISIQCEAIKMLVCWKSLALSRNSPVVIYLHDKGILQQWFLISFILFFIFTALDLALSALEAPK